uniref:deoxyribonuclease I-like 1-like isoform X2 n=1 Tax=Scatophagus argus TaxID=75038 RepID=UPI001ED817D7|nr:deoxyribonuclease I-like 1-like isoform X2 [Scatophagus argus]
MEQTFAELLSDAFSETSVPLFPDGDLDFENLNFDEKLEEDETGIAHENIPTEDNEALHQEAANHTADIYTAENADEKEPDEENFQGVGVTSVGQIQEEDYTSSDGDSEQEGIVSGEDEEDGEEDMGTGGGPGELSVCSSNKEDRIFAEGQPLAPEGVENPQVRNEDQGDSKSDEEVSYFEKVPERGSGMMIKGIGMEDEEQEREKEKREDLSDSECESMKIKEEENVLTLCFEQEVENPSRDGPAKVSLEFPEISVQKLQDLIAEVDSKEYVEKMEDFSGEEHQEAGESFADYPSDFSSCEYTEDGVTNKEKDHQYIAKQDTCLERDVMDIRWSRNAEDTDKEGDEYLYSIDLEVDADKFRGLEAVNGERERELVEHMLTDAARMGCDDGGETSDSDSCSSSDDDDDDEAQVKRNNEYLEYPCLRDLENNKQPEELHSESSAGFVMWSTFDDYNRVDLADFNTNMSTTDAPLSEDLLTAEDTDKEETLFSDVTRSPAEGVNTYSIVQRGDAETKSPSNQGSLDDSFFFNTEPEAETELGQLEDDDYEEERNWEQEQERIKAFYEFYDDSDIEDGREGRRTKVQFCMDPLSQVIHYETDSDRESLSSSTEGEEDQSSAETSEELREPDDSKDMRPACDPPDPPQIPQNLPDLNNTQTCTRKNKCLNILKVTLKMCVVIVMGLLMFWVATDQAGWLSQE